MSDYLFGSLIGILIGLILILWFDPSLREPRK